MIRDITIGQYYPADSAVHKLDPRVKLFATLIYIIALFVFRGIAGFAVITAALAAAVHISKVPLSYMVKGLKAIVILLFITGIFNLLFTPGDVVYWSMGPFKLTDTGIQNAVLMVVRLIYLILGTSLMTLTTTPNQLTDGLEKALGPLNRIHVPVHVIAMMMSIALRFIPMLLEKTDRIMKAQMARGAAFDEGNLIKKAKSMVPLLVPLLVSSFQIAGDLAMAMENRCYRGGEGRTKMKPLQYKRRDYITYIVVLVYFAACIAAGRIVPWGRIF